MHAQNSIYNLDGTYIICTYKSYDNIMYDSMYNISANMIA